MNKLLYLVLGILTSWSLSVSAEESKLSQKLPNTYQFELIIYSDLNDTTLSSESWPVIAPSNYHFVDPTSSDYLSYLTMIHYLPSDATAYSLNKIIRKLKANHNITIISHLAWQEQVPTPDNALPIRIYGGNAYGADGNILATNDVTVAATSQNNDSLTPIDNTLTPNNTQAAPINSYPFWEVNGQIMLSLNHYFDTRFNLLFAVPTSDLPFSIHQDNGLPNTNLTYFHLLQTRRTRSGELNYIDNPLYRILFVINKIKTPTPTDPHGTKDNANIS